MARKKHHAKRKIGSTRRRGHRRIGAAPGSLMHTVESLGGLVVGSMAATVMQRQFTSVNPKLISLGQIAAGIFLTKRPEPLLVGAGWGIAGAGAIGLTHEIGLIHGVEDMMNGIMGGDSSGGNNEFNYVSGLANGTVLNGMSNNTMLSGINGIANQDYLSGTDTETAPAPAAAMPMNMRSSDPVMNSNTEAYDIPVMGYR